jgi:hypothetical protein
LLCFLHCSKSELFAVVKQPQGLEGPTHISLVTDNANALVLHWGVSKAGEEAAALECSTWPAVCCRWLLVLLALLLCIVHMLQLTCSCLLDP